MPSILSSALNHQQIEHYLPHAGNMSLLHTVSYADATQLKASAISHLDRDNPLRINNKLASVNGIEYAAQAMAIHGFLLSEQAEAQKGYIATVRNIEIKTPFFPETEPLIDIEVQQLMSDSHGFTYQFHLSSGKKTLISGRITVFLIKTSS